VIKQLTIGFILLLVVFTMEAQEYPKKEIDLSILADELFGFQDLDLNYEDLYENLAQLLANPINLNKANGEELRFLNILSELQIQALLKHRQENGPLLSVYEIQSIPGFDLITINRIIPFVRVEYPALIGSLLKRVWTEENNYLILRYDRTLETKAGFKESSSTNSRFLGNKDDLYIRFRTSNTGDFSVGFTIEKDAGEQITLNPSNRQYGFDYYSFHAQIMNKGKIKNLILGDYQTQFGQGLLLGSTFGYGKGSETVTTIRRSNLGFLPYTSVNETGYKRGIALTYQLTPTLFLSPFYSSARRDASYQIDTLEVSFASSIQTSGFHRNENELKTRQRLQERNYGAVLNFRKNAFDAGLIFNTIDFGVPIIRDAQSYNQFSFSGTSNTNVGAFLSYTLHNFTLFSEAAQTLHNGYGLAIGLLGSLTPKLDIALHYRNYQQNFYSFYYNAFSESSAPQNETGIYWGLKYRWNRKFSASGYTDLFWFPWLRYRSYIPSEGYEWLVRLNYQPTKTILLFIQGREESKVRNVPSEQSNLYLTDEGVKRNYWINCDYGITSTLKLKTRVQFSTYELGDISTKGLTLLQDVSIDLGRLSLTARYALFDTEDYDNRQYVYERDVWLAYSLPAYSGKGVRKYILAQYTVNKHLTFWIRYANTRYTDREEIGSGVETIEGNVRNDVRVQMRLKL